MQNTPVVNIEIKSVPAANKVADVPLKASEDSQGLSPFEETLSKELKKVDADKIEVKRQKNSVDALAEKATKKANDDLAKAEKKVTPNGNELPLSKHPDEVAPPIAETDQIELSDDTVVVSELKAITSDEKIVNETPQVVSKDLQQEKVNVEFATTKQQVENAEPKANLKHVVADESVRHERVSNETAKQTNSGFQKAVVNTPSQPEQTSETSQQAVTSKPDKQTTSSDIKQTVPSNVELPKQINEHHISPADSSKKELVIKQISIAKEKSVNPDSANQAPVINAILQKSDNTPKQNKLKTDVPLVSINSELKVDKTEKQLELPKHLNLKSDFFQQNSFVTGEPATAAQRETMTLDKKLVEILETVPLRSPRDEKVQLTSPLPLAGTSPSQLTSTVSGLMTYPVLDVQPTLKTEAWERVMAGRVVWMAREGIQRADLKLNPANLGPVEVRLTINNDQASVSFVAQSVATREALEQSLPRLREGFQANGLSLTNADVSDQSMGQQQGEYHQPGSGILFSQEMDEEEQIDESLIIDDDRASGLSLFV